MLTPLPHQQRAIHALLGSLSRHGVAFDASEPGTGKTLTAIEVCRALNVRPAVVAPKAAIPGWERHARLQGVEPAFLCTWERIRRGTTPWLEYRRHFKWTVPHDALLIFDEVHMAKATDSLNSKLHRAASNQGLASLNISATAATNPLEMRALGLALNLYTEPNFWSWATRHGVRKNYHGKGFGFLPRSPEEAERILLKIHNHIFPEYGIRIRIADVPDFPDTFISPECHEVPTPRQPATTQVLANITARDLAEKEEGTSTVLTQTIRERQHAEVRKVEMLVEMTKTAVDEGRNVVVFFNFLESIRLFAAHFPSPIYAELVGGQAKQTRASNVTAFQTGRARVLAAQIAAGGQSVDLHDVDGRHPRLALICPTYSATELRQVLGRVRRSGGRSPSVQRIIFAQGTVEEDVCRAVEAKLNNLELLTDGELTGELDFSTRTA